MKRAAEAALVLAVFTAFLVVAPPGVSADGELTVRIEAIDDDGVAATTVVTVLGPDGRPVVGLEDGDFVLTDDGESAAVLSVTRAQDASVGIAVVLAIDTSLSMEQVIDAARTGAGGAISGLGLEDQAAIVAFSRSVDTLQPLTGDAAALDAALDSLVAIGPTALYDAVLAAVEVARDAPLDRRVVILLTDGFDEGSSATQTEALAAAATSGVPIYAIAFGANTDEAFLREIAAASGGSFLLAPDAEAMLTAYEEFASVLRSQYVIEFAPGPLTTEAERVLEVTVTSAGVTDTAFRSYTSSRPLLTEAVTGAQPTPVTEAPVAQPAAEGEAPAVVATPVSGESQVPILLAAVVAGVLLLALVAWLVIRRRRRPTVSARPFFQTAVGKSARALHVPDAPRVRASLQSLHSDPGVALMISDDDLVLLDENGIRADGRGANKAPGVARIWWRDGKLMLHRRSALGHEADSTWATLETGDVIEVGLGRYRVEIDPQPTESEVAV